MSKTNTVETTDIRQLSEIPNIMSCVMTHKAISTTCDFTWKGPKLNEVWPGILAFFKWTYETNHSESQVRLFVNSRTKEWKAWAFPQKAKLGMSAHEITQGEEGYELAAEQRAMFNDAEGWVYWGTVHHHCACSAFQSGTDSANERGQEGIHITVGNLNTNQYDIHFRVYKGGFKLTSVKLSEFWDIGPVLETVPELMRPFLNPEWVELVAKKQMGIPKPDAEFPEIWRTNVMDVTPKQMVHVQQQQRWEGNQTHMNYSIMKRSFIERSKPNFEVDTRKARIELHGMIAQHANPKFNWEDVLQALETINQLMDDDCLNIMDICARNDVTPEGLYDYLIKQAHAEAFEQKKLEDERSKNGGGVSRKERRKQQQQWLITGNPPHWSDQGFTGYEGMMGD